MNFAESASTPQFLFPTADQAPKANPGEQAPSLVDDLRLPPHTFSQHRRDSVLLSPSSSLSGDASNSDACSDNISPTDNLLAPPANMNDVTSAIARMETLFQTPPRTAAQQQLNNHVHNAPLSLPSSSALFLRQQQQQQQQQQQTPPMRAGEIAALQQWPNALLLPPNNASSQLVASPLGPFPAHASFSPVLSELQQQQQQQQQQAFTFPGSQLIANVLLQPQFMQPPAPTSMPFESSNYAPLPMPILQQQPQPQPQLQSQPAAPLNLFDNYTLSSVQPAVTAASFAHIASRHHARMSNLDPKRHNNIQKFHEAIITQPDEFSYLLSTKMPTVWAVYTTWRNEQTSRDGHRRTPQHRFQPTSAMPNMQSMRVSAPPVTAQSLFTVYEEACHSDGSMTCMLCNRRGNESKVMCFAYCLCKKCYLGVNNGLNRWTKRKLGSDVPTTIDELQRDIFDLTPCKFHSSLQSPCPPDRFHHSQDEHEEDRCTICRTICALALQPNAFLDLVCRKVMTRLIALIEEDPENALAKLTLLVHEQQETAIVAEAPPAQVVPPFPTTQQLTRDMNPPSSTHRGRSNRRKKRSSKARNQQRQQQELTIQDANDPVPHIARVPAIRNQLQGVINRALMIRTLQQHTQQAPIPDDSNISASSSNFFVNSPFLQ